jgi:restriction system protein
VKKGFTILLLMVGIFSTLIAFVSLGMKQELGTSGMLGMFFSFGVIAFVCFFFSRGLFIGSVNKYDKMKRENVELVKEIKDKKEQIETLDNRLHELSGQVNGLYKQKEKLEKERDEYLKTIGEYKKEFSVDFIDTIDNMEGVEFEEFIAKLLKKYGYKNVKTTKASNDYGIDVLAEKERVKYAFQCKNYSSDVGNKAVQEVYSGKKYYDCHVGVVVTNRFFTRQAIELAKKNDILLWDRNKLKSMIEKM